MSYILGPQGIYYYYSSVQHIRYEGNGESYKTDLDNNSSSSSFIPISELSSRVSLVDDTTYELKLSQYYTAYKINMSSESNPVCDTNWDEVLEFNPYMYYYEGPDYYWTGEYNGKRRSGYFDYSYLKSHFKVDPKIEYKFGKCHEFDYDKNKLPYSNNYYDGLINGDYYPSYDYLYLTYDAKFESVIEGDLDTTAMSLACNFSSWGKPQEYNKRYRGYCSLSGTFEYLGKDLKVTLDSSYDYGPL